MYENDVICIVPNAMIMGYAHVKMHCNVGTNIECNTCRIRRIVHNASIVRTTTKCKIAIMLENVIENSKMIYNAL
jgi:hypothetical protein